MSPSMAAMDEKSPEGVCDNNARLQKGVKNLCGSGISKVPAKYILPVQERPVRSLSKCGQQPKLTTLPVIDFSKLQCPNHNVALKSLATACKDYGFFQLVNHGIPKDVIGGMVGVSERFFKLPFEERLKYMSSNMFSPVRYGTSFNQSKDEVFCWRDFLKLTCRPIEEMLPHWPSSPLDMRESVATYAREVNHLFMELMGAVLRSLAIDEGDEHDTMMQEFNEGSQLMVVNCYPPCPQPDLTLGMPPHSDYGFLTLLLQDQVEGLQIQHQDEWVTVQPIPDALVINVGDHLEIFSNGRYKSVLHRVLVNSTRPRISIASIHSLPQGCTVRPSPRLVDEANPQRYRDTDFASFLEYASSREPKKKDFLESRKLLAS